MGGFGSGRRDYRSSRETTDGYTRLDINYLNRQGLLYAGCRNGLQWSRNGKVLSSIRFEITETSINLMYRCRIPNGEWQDMNYPVLLERTACHYGGFRTWFRCPADDCGRRVAVLYGGKLFACRHCYGLAYKVQRENQVDRLARRADRIRDRLGWEPGILNPEGGKPKGMHWRTYTRLYVAYSEFTIRSIQGMNMMLRGQYHQLQTLRLKRK